MRDPLGFRSATHRPINEYYRAATPRLAGNAHDVEEIAAEILSGYTLGAVTLGDEINRDRYGRYCEYAYAIVPANTSGDYDFLRDYELVVRQSIGYVSAVYLRPTSRPVPPVIESREIEQHYQILCGGIPIPARSVAGIEATVVHVLREHAGESVWIAGEVECEGEETGEIECRWQLDAVDDWSQYRDLTVVARVQDRQIVSIRLELSRCAL